MRFEDQRQLLVKELYHNGISDPLVLHAFAKVPREAYVLPELREYAYRNQPLPIHLKQTISQPLMVALMLQHLELKPQDIVLEIGTGSGYEAALLAEIVSEVCTIERLEALSMNAKKILKEQGYKNIWFRIGDGALGWQKAYPPYEVFNKIVVSAAAPQIPDNLVAQLAVDGILVVPVGNSDYQILTKIRNANNDILTSEHGQCAFVPLITTC
ncbi:MAG: protein-L-isoaspartate(D-aspartate) O-methyltransferase [Candidatus Cloacimonetes bacterium HGW-Cloacimonetes-1]|jgi:protein-L-isoaspartate(D-aspartate) O-methyltransferase|nr:MAG: protein-L-isoaspartate(D-aspartate) O-methyltransferase [Candidatus Cloacimonetes bacterium HGW-Cloacimonetes-1]